MKAEIRLKNVKITVEGKINKSTEEIRTIIKEALYKLTKEN